jgi:hypothetical protein
VKFDDQPAGNDSSERERPLCQAVRFIDRAEALVDPV